MNNAHLYELADTGSSLTYTTNFVVDKNHWQVISWCTTMTFMSFLVRHVDICTWAINPKTN